MIALLLDIPPPRQRATRHYRRGGNRDRGCSCARGGDWKHEHRGVASHFTFLPVLQTFRLVVIESGTLHSY